jgi:hypothetical protein
VATPSPGRRGHGHGAPRRAATPCGGQGRAPSPGASQGPPGRRWAPPHRLAGTSERLTQDIEAHMVWPKAHIATLDADLETMLRGRSVPEAL